MPNSFFQFRRFTIYQDRCAMKVGTDGTLLGAWASVPSMVEAQRVLDIGTGTGLIALMMAQRFPQALVTGIDIDEAAVQQARENAAASPFAARVAIVSGDVTVFSDREVANGFDAIVCNPPYFTDSLQSPDAQRTLARHTATLSYRALMESAWRLLGDGGELSVIIPFDCKARLEAEALLAGFFKTRECAVRTTVRKPSRRFLMAFRKHPAQLCTEELVIGSEEYRQLMKDFLLK